MPIMKKSFAEYIEEYRAGHTQIGTKLTHFVGIPMIVASLPILPFHFPLGATLFGVGWALQFVGHFYFEKNNPSFASDPFFLVVGVIWVLVEIAEMLGIHVPLDAISGGPKAETASA